MQVIELEEFHERFEDLIELAAAGETFEIWEKGQPLVKVTPYETEKG